MYSWCWCWWIAAGRNKPLTSTTETDLRSFKTARTQPRYWLFCRMLRPRLLLFFTTRVPPRKHHCNNARNNRNNKYILHSRRRVRIRLMFLATLAPVAARSVADTIATTKHGNFLYPEFCVWLSANNKRPDTERCIRRPYIRIHRLRRCVQPRRTDLTT